MTGKFYGSVKNKIFEFLFQIHLKFLFKNFSENGFKYFLNHKDIEEWADTYNKYFSDMRLKMNRFEATIEMIYERESLEYYAGNKSIEINNFLRGEHVFFPEICIERIISLTKCLENFYLHENVIVLRRIRNENWNQCNKKGKTIIEPAFLSTSLDLNFRKDIHGNFSNFKNETILLLKVPMGTNACYIEPVSKRSEFELLIQRGSRIKIEKTRKFLGNRIVTGRIV